MAVNNPVRKLALNLGAEILTRSGPALAQISPLRRFAVGAVEQRLRAEHKRTCSTSNFPPGVADDRTLMGLAILTTAERALAERHLSPAALRGLFKVLVGSLMLRQGDQETAERFRRQCGMRAPTFLVVSPGKACNLRCTGCYADSGPTAEKLNWDIVDRMITEAKSLWGARLFVISGGEPLAYRSEGKGVLDLAERHSDCFFMMYTNGTLISDEIAAHLARAGNLVPAISVEGWRERTDDRRGRGVFDRVLAAMGRLRQAGVPFGISLTATRHNVEEILSDEFIDFLQGQGVLFGWLFHYMPIGRSFTLDLMPTPKQRVWLWRRSWEIVRQRRMFLADFWNHGTTCDGCLSAGGHGAGGYLYIDWSGAVSPCVFLPYSPLNIKDAYAQGKTLSDVWADPFFGALRQWQVAYKNMNGNGLAPCPIRDHHAELRRILLEHEPDPIDANAAAALCDPEYARGLAEYDAAFQELTGEIWQHHYLRSIEPRDGKIAPLPDLDSILAPRDAPAGRG